MTTVVLASAEPMLSALVRGVNALDASFRVLATTSLATSALDRATPPVAAVFVANPPATWSIQRIDRAVRATDRDAVVSTIFLPDLALADAAQSDRIVSRWLGSSPLASPPEDRRSSVRRASVRLDAELGAPAAARRFVRQVLAEWRREDLLEAAQLCASELATNAVLHAAVDGPVELDLAWSGGEAPEVQLRVADRSVDRLPVGRRPSARSRGGRGLRIVEASASRWGVTVAPDHKVVWCDLRGETPPPVAWVEPAVQGAQPAEPLG